MSESSNNATSRSALIGPGITGPSTQMSSTGTTLSQPTLAKKCFDIVESFRHSRLTKAAAFLAITRIIELEADNTSEKSVTRIATPYFAMLDNYQAEKEVAGETTTRSELPHADAEEGDTYGETGHESESGDDDKRPTKKRVKLDMSCLEQATKSRVALGPLVMLSANLKRTNAVLLNWSQDPKEARRRLMYHELSPEFHESGWMEIVTGKCINLDNVHSIIASSRAIDKHTETIGGIENRYGTSEATSKRITTQSSWFVAWNRASCAILFAFPHRKAELHAYNEYITAQFSSNEEAVHSRIIRFDKAIRNRVASSRRYELSDFAAFQDIFHTHFKNSG